MARLCFFHCQQPVARCAHAVQRYAAEAGLDVEWVDTSASQLAYSDELSRRWTGDDDLILVEQDKELHALCLPTLLHCPQPWCAYAYWVFPEPHTALAIGGFGVTRFSAEIQRRVPVGEFAGEWLGIDRRFLELLKTRYATGCHLHGQVVHHHRYEPRPRAVLNHVASLRAQGLIPPPGYPPPPGPGLLPGMDPEAASQGA